MSSSVTPAGQVPTMKLQVYVAQFEFEDAADMRRCIVVAAAVAQAPRCIDISCSRASNAKMGIGTRWREAVYRMCVYLVHIAAPHPGVHKGDALGRG